MRNKLFHKIYGHNNVSIHYSHPLNLQILVSSILLKNRTDLFNTSNALKSVRSYSIPEMYKNIIQISVETTQEQLVSELFTNLNIPVKSSTLGINCLDVFIILNFELRTIHGCVSQTPLPWYNLLIEEQCYQQSLPRFFCIFHFTVTNIG